MYDWLVEHKIPLGRWIEDVVDWLVVNASWLFDAISSSLRTIIEWGTDQLLAVPPMLLMVIFVAIAYALQRRILLTIFVVIAMLLIANLGYWEAMIETLVLVLMAAILCILIGVPIGILAAHKPGFYAAIRPILDLMQTIPPFVYLIPTLILFGLGVVPGLISTIIFALPAPIRLTALGIGNVPTELLEAGKAFGASRRQLLFRVELPAAMPSIMAGITQCIMLSLSMVVIAAMVGASGLGKPVVRALNTVNISQGFEAGLAIVLLAIVLDRLLKQRKEK